MNLTDHFRREEFEQHGPMPEECVAAYAALCETILEPIRMRWSCPVKITSGYRPPEANREAGGVVHSQHMATADYCATDFRLPGSPNMRGEFDWIRMSDLPFDQVILEHGPMGQADLIHISWVKVNPRRMALEGATANRSGYIPWPVKEEKGWPNA